MSYEGYVQNICANGHYFTSNWAIEPVCPHCSAASAWENHVDETNCDGYGYIPPEEFKKILIQDNQGETCNLGHYHVTCVATHRIPKEGELVRTYRTTDGKLVPL